MFDLAGKIPKCCVDRADGAVADGATDQPHAGVDALALQGIAAHQHRLQRSDQLRSVHRGGITGRAQEGVALQPGIGVNSQQTEIAAGGGGRALMIDRDWNVVPGKDRQRDVVDFHGASPVWVFSRCVREACHEMLITKNPCCSRSGLGIGMRCRASVFAAEGFNRYDQAEPTPGRVFIASDIPGVRRSYRTAGGLRPPRPAVPANWPRRWQRIIRAGSCFPRAPA
jgi:hypothetical protein